MFEVNGYIAATEGSAEAVLIDAPPDVETALAEAGKIGAAIKKILLTHGHYDHVEGLKEIAERTGAEVYIHAADAAKLSDPRENFITGSVVWDGKVKTVKDGDIIASGGLDFYVWHTPGHTGGSVCYITENVIFSGDTLFKLSVGRTDLPSGDGRVLAETLAKIAAFKGRFDDYRILPGHGEATSLSYEIRNNPYIRGGLLL
jgi:glyoxylase-like metal-dependent hydrolase (beta-lactamase superfamily II)